MKNVVPLRVRVGGFALDLRAGELHKNGRIIRLQEKPCRLLQLLVEHRGQLVTRNEIQKMLWPNDTVVDFEHGINAAIKKLRAAFGDSAESPKYIETLARRGYRLVAAVEWITAAEDSSDPGIQVENPAPTAIAVQPGPLPLIGRRVSHYRVLEVIGGGGMGVVYRAEDLKLGRRVALKFLPEELGSDPNSLERFEREARAASALDHPNICSIYEFGEHEGQPFIVMQLLEGQTLRDRLADAKDDGHTLSLDQLLDIAIQVAYGLEAAHEKGIIHRDIKPANIFITSKGVAKILDFGVAKLTSIADEAAENLSNPESTPRAWTPARSDGHEELGAGAGARPASIERTLTRTGMALGTAGYMSPEQVRGEQLDARTDLFSFGLVLYEMATGRRAFSGETAAILHGAILNSAPIPLHELNSAIPSKLEDAINIAIEKDRARRYQSAAELRADLQSLTATPVPGRRWLRIIAPLLAILVVGLGGSLVRLITRHPSRVELSETQLTANSPENQVEGGVVSPNGKYIVFYDMRGLHIKLLETGDTSNIPDPSSLKDFPVDWELLPLSNTRFLATAHVLGRGTSIWTISILGGEPKMLRDNADAGAASPDGSSIAFLTAKGQQGYRELWIMDSNGGSARKILTAEPNSDFQMVGWSPDGRRLIYRRDHSVGDKVTTVLETRDLGGGSPTTLMADPSVWNFVWLPDGRLVYVLISIDIGSSSCNFWQMRVDSESGKPLEMPSRLTNWTSFCVGSLSATADGKRLVFNKWWASQTIYVDDFVKNSSAQLNPHRLTLTDSAEYPVGWTADSKEVVFLSRRTGRWGYHRQALGQEQEQTITSDTKGLAKGSMSPDHQWVFFVCCQDDGHFPSANTAAALRLMRVPVTGGTPQTILTLTSPAEPIGHFKGRYLQPPSCTVAPAKLCVIAERTSDGHQLVFTSFDPMKGRGRELVRYDIDPTASYKWALSPDGDQIAVFARSEDRIHLLSLSGQAPSELKVKGWNVLQAAYWAPDGKGLFVSSVRKRNSVLLYVDMRGNARDLWELAGEQDGGSDAYAIPSPDEHHLAIRGWTINSNMWMLENF